MGLRPDGATKLILDKLDAQETDIGTMAADIALMKADLAAIRAILES